MKKAVVDPAREGQSLMPEIEEKLEETQALLSEINRTTLANLEKINDNIEQILEMLGVESAKVKSSGFKPSILLEFPDHLRKTVRVLLDMGMATADEISEKTGRSRSLESSYLNQLTNMGYVEKKRKGQIVYYTIKFDKEKVKVD
jgi:DNA-binding transcriptional ArsR family regulator